MEVIVDSHQGRVLLNAVELRCVKAVRTVLDLGLPDKMSQEFSIRRSIFFKELEILKILVQCGCSMGDTNYMLQEAVNSGDVRIVRFVVSLGADIHKSSKELLVTASRYGYMDIATLLVKNGVGHKGLCLDAFYAAILNGHLPIVKLLVEHTLMEQWDLALATAEISINPQIGVWLTEYDRLKQERQELQAKDGGRAKGIHKKRL